MGNLGNLPVGSKERQSPLENRSSFTARLPESAGQRHGNAVSNVVRPLTLLALLALVICAASHADSPTRGLQELRRFKAAEARQAVAVDAHHFYAIGNREIGKYDKRTGERVGG